LSKKNPSASGQPIWKRLASGLQAQQLQQAVQMFGAQIFVEHSPAERFERRIVITAERGELAQHAVEHVMRVLLDRGNAGQRQLPARFWWHAIHVEEGVSAIKCGGQRSLPQRQVPLGTGAVFDGVAAVAPRFAQAPELCKPGQLAECPERRSVMLHAFNLPAALRIPEGRQQRQRAVARIDQAVRDALARQAAAVGPVGKRSDEGRIGEHEEFSHRGKPRAGIDPLSHRPAGTAFAPNGLRSHGRRQSHRRCQSRHADPRTRHRQTSLEGSPSRI
jgi:hypothetical protein